MENGYEIIRIDENTWRIEDGGVRFFLLTGTEKALLIDSGMQVRNAREIAEGLTNLPLRLLNTHADRDHIGSNAEFDAPYMSLSELPNYHSGNKGGEVTPVWDGDVIDLGDRRLTVIALPGHTPGSIAVLDERNRVLISGDPIQDGIIFMTGVHRDMTAYRHSLLRLKAMGDRFDEIWPSHGTLPVKPEIIDRLIEGAEKVMRREVTPRPSELFGGTLDVYDVGVARFLCDRQSEGDKV